MTQVESKPATQFTNVNITDTLFVDTVKVQPPAASHITINKVEDFPTQDATTITLDAGVNFLIGKLKSVF